MDDNGYRKIIEELIDLLQEGVYIVDEKGIGLFYSDEMAKNEQIKVSDVIGKPFNMAFPRVGLDESTMYRALRKGLATRNKQQTYTNLYGKEVTTLNSTVPVKLDGKTIAAVEVARDITDIRSIYSDRKSVV